MKNQERKYLDGLTTAVCQFLGRLDEEMKQPSTYERGKRIAALCNQMDMANDRAMHFGLELSLRQIDNRKRKAVRK